MAEDIIRMSQKELKRLHVIRKVLEGQLYQVEAAAFLSLSVRQTRRLVKRVGLEGDMGLAHKSRGKPSARRTSLEVKEKAIRLYRDKYMGFGPVLASEKLSERDGIGVSDETLRNWLIESGDWKKERKKRAHRQWRERKERFGEMLQMDGSHHDWLEGRGPGLVLMGCIDDATGKAFGRFYGYEGTMPAMDCFKRYARRYGLARSVYLDKHTTYKSPGKLTPEEELRGLIEPQSQFERALNELGVEVIHANSPQAKGRIERLFKTLQDRLVKEMRLRGIKTKEEANRFLGGYLARHNKRFGRLPSAEGDLHGTAPDDLDEFLCIKTKRALRNDFTIAHEGKLYQILESVRARELAVEEKIDGRMLIKHNGGVLRFKEISARPPREKPLKPFKARKKYIPPKDHPWRKHSPVAKKRTFLFWRKEDISTLA